MEEYQLDENLMIAATPAQHFSGRGLTDRDETLWATFNLSLHTWYDPMERLTKSADSLGVLAATPVVGETTIYGEYIPTTKWWNEILAGKD